MSRLFDALAHLRAVEGLLLAFEARCPVRWERTVSEVLSSVSGALDELEGLAQALAEARVVAPSRGDPPVALSSDLRAALADLADRRPSPHDLVGDLVRLGLARFDDEYVLRLTERGRQALDVDRSSQGS